MLALEKPHCGVSGVPFMNNTTGAEATALSIACLVASDRSRCCASDSIGDREKAEAAGLEAREAMDDAAGRAACRSSCCKDVLVFGRARRARGTRWTHWR